MYSDPYYDIDEYHDYLYKHDPKFKEGIDKIRADKVIQDSFGKNLEMSEGNLLLDAEGGNTTINESELASQIDKYYDDPKGVKFDPTAEEAEEYNTKVESALEKAAKANANAKAIVNNEISAKAQNIINQINDGKIQFEEFMANCADTDLSSEVFNAIMEARKAARKAYKASPEGQAKAAKAKAEAQALKESFVAKAPAGVDAEEFAKAMKKFKFNKSADLSALGRDPNLSKAEKAAISQTFKDRKDYLKGIADFLFKLINFTKSSSYRVLVDFVEIRK